ncbi:MAG: orotate phosphoribosyltransferase [Pirellulaceae bacterium]|nr:orotate phosphoribosyltransferase [Pirellulaceae bacterium]
MYDRDALQQLIRELALREGQFTLASGKSSHYYLDCRKVTLASAGAHWIAAGILELLGEDLPDAVGGMAIGADPITAAVITLAAVQQKSLRGFIVRKESKQHGTGQQVEGPVEPGDRVVIVEDVVTTGGSSLKAVQHARDFGLQVESVIGIVDRLEGGAEVFAEQQIPFQALFTIRDFGLEPIAS